MTISRDIDSVESKEDFADFLAALRNDLIENPDDWENQTLDRFLDGMESWVRVIDAYSRNAGDVEVLSPSWKTFAKILSAAKVYE
ncbi:DUF7660 family protein [Pseudomonas xantholysinigenes]|uniref:DUF7660 family protein n=1 Tax=Pseudomonas xantholysinigenes TaxID=2745490 RepID=UPI003F5A257A